MKKIMMMAAAVAMLAMTACGGKAQKAETEEVKEEAKAEVLYRPGQAVEVPTVLDFNAVWCIPCKKLAAPFEEAAKAFEGKVAFKTIDIDKDPETTKAFGVEEIPCVVMIKTDGSYEVFPSLGDFISEDDLKLSPEEVNSVILKSITEKVNNVFNL